MLSLVLSVWQKMVKKLYQMFSGMPVQDCTMMIGFTPENGHFNGYMDEVREFAKSDSNFLPKRGLI